MPTRSCAVAVPQHDPSYPVCNLLWGIRGVPGNLSCCTAGPHITSYRGCNMGDVDIACRHLDSRGCLNDERTEDSDGGEDRGEAACDFHCCLEVVVSGCRRLVSKMGWGTLSTFVGGFIRIFEIGRCTGDGDGK
jgi:hypothetical protein